MSTTSRPTIVLVHGAWHRPETFAHLQEELTKLGHASKTVKLPSTGPDPAGGLHDDAAVIRAGIEAVPGPVVVLGHSYGGLPMTEAAAGLSNVKRLIYLAAYMPDTDQSMFRLHGAPDPDDTDDLFPAPKTPRDSFYHDVPEAEAAEAERQLVTQRAQSFGDRVNAVAWHDVPATYIITEQDHVISPALQEKMAAQAKDVRRIDSSHSPFLSRPAELAALVDDIVKGD